MKRFALKPVVVLLSAVAFTEPTHAQAETVELYGETPVEVRVVSKVYRRGKREKITAIIGNDVVVGKERTVVISRGKPVKIRITTKRDRQLDRKIYRVETVSVKAVDGQTVRLAGGGAKESRGRTLSDKRAAKTTALALAPFGTVVKMSDYDVRDHSSMVVLSDVSVDRTYTIRTGK